jgi:autotransporter-associated beta strand protein
MPKTAETTGMIGAEQFRLMKPTAYVVNVARGGLIAPGMVDPHLHIESSMVTACAYAEAALINGTTTIANGTLSLGNGGAEGLIASTSSITNNGTLVYNLTSSGTLGMVISGNGSLVKQSTGTLTLSGANTYTGVTTISAGTLALGASNAIANTSDVSVAAGSTLALGGYSDTVGRLTGAGAVSLGAGTLTSTYSGGGGFRIFSGVISGSGGFTLAGASDFNDFLTINGSNTYTGATTLTGATLILGADNSISSSSALVISGGRLSASNRNQTFHSLTMDSGAILRDGGTLAFSNGASFNGGSVTIRNNGGVISSSGATTLGNVTFTYNASTSGLDALVLGGNVVVTSGASALFEMGPAGGQGFMKLGDTNRVFDVGENATATVNWVIHSTTLASGALTKNGSGTFVMNAVNTYTGGTTVNAGTLVLGHASNTLANAAAVTVNGGTLSLGANSDTIGALTLNGGSITGTSGILTASSYSLLNGTVTAILAGSASINKTTSGTLTLAGANTYTGATTISAGTLALGASNVITDTSDVAVASGAVLELGGFNDTIGKLTGGGAVNLGSGTLTTTYGSGSGTFSGVLSGTGSFTLAGATDYNAYLTINGSNTYTGATNVLGATLILGANNVLSSSSTLNIAGGRFSASNRNQTLHSVNMTSGVIERNGGNLKFNNASSLTGGNVNIGNSGGTIETGSTLTLGNVTFTYNASTANFNALVLGGDIAVESGATASMVMGSAGGGGFIKLGDANRTFDVGENANMTINWVVTSNTLSAGAVTKNGLGTLTLNAGNPYTGGTTVNAGTLVLGHATDTLANAAAVTVNGGTLSLGANSDTIGALTLTGGVIASTSGVLTASSYALQNGTVSAILGGSASINKTTAGTVTLSAANTFSGGITLGGGTLVLGNANAAGSGVINQTSGSSVLSIDTGGTISNTMSVSNVLARQSATLNGTITVNNATFDVENGDTLTIAGGVGGTGGVTKNGGGVLVLSGSNTYSGATTVNSGTLNAANANALGTNASVTVHGGSLLVSADGALAAKNITLNSTTTAGLVFSGNYNGSIGKLTLAANSIIDLGVGNNVVARFAELEFLNDSILKIYHWDGTPLWEGGNGNNPDQIYFASGATGNLGRISFYSDFGNAFLGNGYQILGGDFANQVIPVPEPETWLAAALLASFGLVGLLRKKFPKILKYEPRS